MHTARMKISTTVAPETHEYLECLVHEGQAANLAEAIDQAVSEARRVYSMKRLEQATAAYFAALSGKTATEESCLDAAVSRAIDEVNLGE